MHWFARILMIAKLLSIGNNSGLIHVTSNNFRLKFWGTRGSIPCPGPSTTKYGGNTTCFEITCGDKRIIIDAGTGVRLLGKHIMLNEGNLLDADLFFTHTHMDHIQGLPFFAPLYNPNSNVRLNAGHLDGDTYDLQGIIGTMLMKDPVFPVLVRLSKKLVTLVILLVAKLLISEMELLSKQLPLITPMVPVDTVSNITEKILAICTDTEHYEDRLDENVVELGSKCGCYGL